MYVVPLSVVRAQKSLHMTPRALYSACVGACTHVNEANGVVNSAVCVTFPVEIPVRSPTITDDRSAGLELLGKRVQRCRSLPQASITAIKVSVVLSGTSTKKRFTGLALNTAKHPLPLNRGAPMVFF